MVPTLAQQLVPDGCNADLDAFKAVTTCAQLTTAWGTLCQAAAVCGGGGGGVTAPEVTEPEVTEPEVTEPEEEDDEDPCESMCPEGSCDGKCDGPEDAEKTECAAYVACRSDLRPTMPDDAVLCPDKAADEYCDCSGDCKTESSYCGCDEAVACCAANDVRAPHHPSPAPEAADPRPRTLYSSSSCAC